MYLIDMWLSEDQRANTTTMHVLEEIGLHFSNITNYSTLDNEHILEDLRIQSRKQQTCTSDTQN